ncbi:hypothetical protein GALL_179820 [mine drainage metagenome]|uniref:PEP-CTERM protein-sorting domain-containing protein n=1 Tax=mine drainage metagenome TaxID=410659 RepID=A0A1J5RVH6_9ZZZZ
MNLVANNKGIAMRLFKIFNSVAFAGILAVSNASYATDHDVNGSTSRFNSSYSFTQLASKIDESDMDILLFKQNSKISPFRHSDESKALGAIHSDFTFNLGDRKHMALLVGENEHLSFLEDHGGEHDFDGRHSEHSDKYRPVEAVPEPRGFIMMLAGFGLFFLISRHRKNSSL